MSAETIMRATTVRAAAVGTLLLLAACGNNANQNTTPIPLQGGDVLVTDPRAPREAGIFDLFNSPDTNTTLRVNRYIWNASLDVLNFLPIESVDPFSGVIVTGYGVPPGGGRAYRATVYVQDPALDARSLKVALQTQGGGAVSRETVRAVEDAILTRARQLRIQDGRL
ncbi:DUF3576 domain-containing protein [Halodurantibacterium flavum]|uniref:DUF3576 domain-containing protein n=1 Tax=Halodurantibacterium flavum TaxID=1382802 RepID=A0ABW4S6W4_9RHOB